MKNQINKSLSLALALTALAFNLSMVQSVTAVDFTNSGALHAARYLHSATLLTNGQVMVAGGFNTSFGIVSGTESYNPGTGLWSTNGNLITPRQNHTATLLPDGRVLIAGGESESALTNAELFNPVSGIWAATGSLTNARSYHTATLLPDGQVLVAGGFNPDFGAIASCELYNPATAAWTDTGDLNNPRLQHTATLLTNGLVLVVGGDGAGTCELYEPVSGTWTVTGSNLTPRQNHTATLLPNGLVLVAGGSGDNTSELYDPGTGTWTATGLMNASRMNPTATLLLSGQVLVAGGYDAEDGSIVLSSAETYDPASGTWATNMDMNSVRAQQTATLLPAGKVLMTGGWDGDNGVAISEIYTSAAIQLPIRLAVIRQPPGGAFKFGFTNTPGLSFTALTTTNVSLALGNWNVTGPVLEIAPGVFQFSDPLATNFPQRFYRVRSP